MNSLPKALVILLALLIFAPWSRAQRPQQSEAPADVAVAQHIEKALEEAGIDPRTTSVQVTTTADHTVYLTGLISDKDKIKLAGDVATKTASGYRVVNNIRSSFFDDPNHVNGGDHDK